MALGSELIEIKKRGFTMKEDQHNSVIQNIDFHPNSQILLSSGLDKTVRIFRMSDNYEGDESL